MYRQTRLGMRFRENNAVSNKFHIVHNNRYFTSSIYLYKNICICSAALMPCGKSIISISWGNYVRIRMPRHRGALPRSGLGRPGHSYATAWGNRVR